ncbi:MAG: hypothetical protein J6K13_11395 [Clostridia bacterium]|nr:hypothetical protein [Clostridia bacterium]
MSDIKRSKEIGLVAAVAIVAVLLYMIFSAPGIGAVADGSYDTVMRQLHLTCPEGTTFQTGVVMETFAYQRLDYTSILKPGQIAMAYPAMLVRLVTEPFGLLFSTKLLACAYMLIIAVGTYLAVSGLYRRLPMAGVLTACGLVLLMMHSTLVGYLNSLYDIGAVIAFAVLYLGCLVHALCKDRGCGAQWAVWVALSGTALIRSQTQMVVLVPFVLVGIALAMFHCCPRGKALALHAAVCAFAMLFCVQGVYDGFVASPEADEDANDYLAVFQGYMLASDDVTGDLAQFGLDESYAADVGRSYYEPSENFVHDPHSKAETAMLDSISLGKRLMFCIQNPDVVMRRIEQLGNHLYDAFNQRLMTTDGQTRYVRPSLLPLVRLLTREGDFNRMTGWMLAAAAASFLLLLVTPKRSGMSLLAVAMGCLHLGFVCYFPFSMMLTGGIDVDKFKVVFFFLGWFSLISAVVAGLCLAARLLEWLSDAKAARKPQLAAAGEGSTGLAWLDRVHVSQNGLVAVSALACVALSCWLLLSDVHVGGINNGDYGRMMDQLDIKWTAEMEAKQSEQAGVYVVEEYDYSDPFDATKLSPLDPNYSLIYPTALVRLWSHITGEPFNTVVLALILLFFTTLSVLLIIHDLYPLLGKATLLVAAGLIAMVFGENYVAWYNALFGESSISTGLMMTIACAIHLIMMKRGSWKSWLWMLLLAFSVRFLACAKAQMALALPIGLVLIAVLAWYHRPRGIIRTIAAVMVTVFLLGGISFDTLTVYQKNAGVSERHTVWQSVFFGALMIAEDVDAAMEELGIAPEMKVDIGKHAYYPDEDYVYAPLSDEAQTAFYDQVNTFTMVGYYLRHPLDFLYMLDRAAGESVDLHTGFMAYTDEIYEEHEDLYRFNIWRNLRPVTACRHFWQYVVLYGAVIIWCIWYMTRKNMQIEKKLLTVLFLCVMIIGVFQYPLSVVGNGFADNNKQLYGFMLCHDLLVLSAVTSGAWCLVKRIRDERRNTSLQEG